MQSDNFTAELQARGATQPKPVYRVYDFNAAVGGPIVKDKLWYYMSVREQGQRQNTLNVYYNQNAGNPNALTYVPDLEQAGVLRSHVGELHAAHHVAGDRSATSSRSRGTSSRSAASCTGTTSLTRLAELHLPDLARGGRPRRVQPAARPAGALDVAADQQAAARSRASARPTTSGAASEVDPNPTRDLVQVVEPHVRPSRPASRRRCDYRSQSWLNNKTRGCNVERGRRRTSPVRTA